MTSKTVSGLPLASTPLQDSDRIVVSRNGVILQQAQIADLEPVVLQGLSGGSPTQFGLVERYATGSPQRGIYRALALNKNARDFITSGVVGANTPAAGTFTLLTVGDASASAPILTIDGAVNTDRSIRIKTASVDRWRIRCSNDTESGSNAGSAFFLTAFADNGATIDTPFAVTRASGGEITLGGTSARQVRTTGELEVDGALDHDGSTVGFYGVTPVSRPAAYTQTYATATRTHNNAAQTAVATTGATMTAPFGYTTAAQANDIVTQLNNARTDILELKQLINSIIDDDQSQGLKQ